MEGRSPTPSSKKLSIFDAKNDPLKEASLHSTRLNHYIFHPRLSEAEALPRSRLGAIRIGTETKQGSWDSKICKTFVGFPTMLTSNKVWNLLLARILGRSWRKGRPQSRLRSFKGYVDCGKTKISHSEGKGASRHESNSRQASKQVWPPRPRIEKLFCP